MTKVTSVKHGVSETQTRARLMSTTMQAFHDLLQHLLMLRLSGAVANWVARELTFAQFKALVMLAHHEALTMSQLAKLLGTGNPAASILVQPLVERGLLTRAEDFDDRRRTVVSLSQQGAALVAGPRKEREAQLRRWLNRLSDEELSSLMRGLNALNDVVQSDREPAKETLAPALVKEK